MHVAAWDFNVWMHRRSAQLSSSTSYHGHLYHGLLVSILLEKQAGDQAGNAGSFKSGEELSPSILQCVFKADLGSSFLLST